MANHKSAIKRHKQNLKNNERNRAERSKMRSAIKDLKEAVSASASTEDLQTKFKSAQKIIAAIAGKGVIAKQTGARYISRLSKLIGKTQAPASK
jgi:small subunit ribosomal protein S20